MGELTVLLVLMVAVGVAMAALPQVGTYVGAQMGRQVSLYALDRLYLAAQGGQLARTLISTAFELGPPAARRPIREAPQPVRSSSRPQA